jgi:hypothetical protein
MATREGPESPTGWDRLRTGLEPDVAVYTLAPWPTYDSVWMTTGKTRTLCWGGGQTARRRLSGPRDLLLRDFALLHRLAGADLEAEAVRLATTYGPLGLCVRHHSPVAHMSKPMVRAVQRALDHLVETGEEDGDWWRLSPCDLREPPPKRYTMPRTKPAVVAARAEPLAAWVHWSQVISGVIAVAWSIQRGQGADLAEWRLLDPTMLTKVDYTAPWNDRYDEDRVRIARTPITNEWLGVPVESIEKIEDLGDGRLRVHATDPTGGASRIIVRSPRKSDESRRQRRRASAGARSAEPLDDGLVHFGTYTDPTTGKEVSFVDDGSGGDGITYIPYEQMTPAQRKASQGLWSREVQRTQKLLVSKVMEDLIRLADLRAQFDWDERPASRLTYGGGTLFGALIAQLTLTIGGANAFAVCDFCRTTWQPEQWPRGGPNDNTLCEAHQTEADKARLRRRVQHAGSVPVPTERHSRPSL